MKLLLSLLVSILSLEAFAGYIVPNIRRDNITKNESGSAVGFSKRANNVGVAIGTQTLEEEYEGDNDNDLDINKQEVQIFHKFGESIGVEASIQNTKYKEDYESDSEEYETDNYRLNVSYLAMENLSLGATIWNFDNSGEGSNDGNRILINSTYNLRDNHYIGGAIGKSAYSNIDEAHTNIYFGYGYLSESLSVEALISHSTAVEDKDSDISIGENTEILGEVNWVRGEWDIYANFIHSQYNDDVDDQEANTTRFEVSPEYKLTEAYFVGLNLESSVTFYEVKDTDYKYEETSSRIGVFGRMKINQFQAKLALNSVSGSFDDKEEDDQDYDTTGTELEINLNYFF